MRAITRSRPNTSRAVRATMMLELSPLVTAASAPASSMPASRRRSRSKPTPWMVRPPKPSGSRRNALACLSMTATVWPCPRGCAPARIRPGRIRPPRRATFAPLPGRDVWSRTGTADPMTAPVRLSNRPGALRAATARRSRISVSSRASSLGAGVSSVASPRARRSAMTCIGFTTTKKITAATITKLMIAVITAAVGEHDPGSLADGSTSVIVSCRSSARRSARPAG